MPRLIACLTLGLALVVPVSSFAADAPWPTQPVRLVVPGDAGGVLDIRARWLAERLTPLLGRSVIVDNRAGAGGAIGTAAGARSPPDGHT